MFIDSEVTGRIRTIWIDGKRYEIRSLPFVAGQDGFRYSLPDGTVYSHPTEFGALLMILKEHAGGSWNSKAREVGN